jgi:hypothetical protein
MDNFRKKGLLYMVSWALGLATKMWRLEESVYNTLVIDPGGIGMEVPLLSFGVGPPSSGHR